MDTQIDQKRRLIAELEILESRARELATSRNVNEHVPALIGGIILAMKTEEEARLFEVMGLWAVNKFRESVAELAKRIK